MIIGIVGRSEDPTGAVCSLGTGKDTVADILVSDHAFQKIGMADPLKRFCMEVYGFSYDQLWGPSALRNKPDKRYPRENHIWTKQASLTARANECECCGVVWGMDDLGLWPRCYLTPRFALQQLGTQWGRHCWDDTWIKQGVKVALELLGDVQALTNKQNMMYTPREGLVSRYMSTEMGDWDRDDAPKGNVQGVVFSDVRFKNELSYIKEQGGKVVLVYREVAKVAASAKDMAHLSERDLNEYGVDHSTWDAVLVNDGDIDSLLDKTRVVLEKFKE